MAKHIWLVKRFMPPTVDMGVAAYRIARTIGKEDLLPACQFAGYCVEQIRQKGRGSSSGPFGLERSPKGIIDYIWDRASRRKMYAVGKNAYYYLYAGRRLLATRLRDRVAQCGHTHGSLLGALIVAFEELSEWQPLHDYLEERGGPFEQSLDTLLMEGEPLPVRRAPPAVGPEWGGAT